MFSWRQPVRGVKKQLIPFSMPYSLPGSKIAAPMAITASILVDTCRAAAGWQMMRQSLKHAMTIYVFWQIVFLSAIVAF